MADRLIVGNRVVLEHRCGRLEDGEVIAVHEYKRGRKLTLSVQGRTRDWDEQANRPWGLRGEVWYTGPRVVRWTEEQQRKLNEQSAREWLLEAVRVWPSLSYGQKMNMRQAAMAAVFASRDAAAMESKSKDTTA